MTPDVMTEPDAPTTRPTGAKSQALKVLVVTPTLEPGQKVPPPVEFANSLVAEGASVMFAAAVGTLRPGLSRSVGYFLIDNAEQAPVKTAHELSRIIRHHPPDVVHTHGAFCAVIAALAIKASRSHCARVMTHHTRQLRRVPRWIKSPMLCHCADRYFATTAELKADLESLGVPADRIHVEATDGGHAIKFARDSIAVYREVLDGRDGTK